MGITEFCENCANYGKILLCNSKFHPEYPGNHDMAIANDVKMCIWTKFENGDFRQDYTHKSNHLRHKYGFYYWLLLFIDISTDFQEEKKVWKKNEGEREKEYFNNWTCVDELEWGGDILIEGIPFLVDCKRIINGVFQYDLLRIVQHQSQTNLLVAQGIQYTKKGLRLLSGVDNVEQA
jgi:hypothetical protein